MSNAKFNVPSPVNEKNLTYAPGSVERKELQEALKKSYDEVVEIPMIINGKEVRTDNHVDIVPPHKINHKVGFYHKGTGQDVKDAIDASLKAHHEWANMPWEHRASIFLKAADLMAGPYRSKINSATMIGQSKNPYQAEIDSAAELIDFFRFNVYYAQQIYEEQPFSGPGMWNRNEYRPLEGFIWAVTPFNFTSIAGNLPSSPALMGNTVVWKPSNKQIYSAKVIMEIFMEAGLPDGVINMIFTDAGMTSNIILSHPEFAGIHFTGSTNVFKGIWKTVGENIKDYKYYPRIVGETGGKDFVVMHESADIKATATALARGAFEYQGQKCSAVSRAYIPSNKWEEVKEVLFEQVKSFKMGDPVDFTNFFNAVIDEKAFDKIAGYIDRANESNDAEIILGGKYDKSEGYFIEPTIVLAKNPKYESMKEEIFGPVLTLYIYDENKFEETLELVDNTSPYALTGAIMSTDRKAIDLASRKLNQSAGNFYINDKPTGAVVGQQPFGGARGSGTNDKAGSLFNLLRWVSVRTIKENFVPPKDYRYPFMQQ